MRKIYLFRHGLPEFPGGVHVCLGLTPDLPLSEEGYASAAAWSEFLRERNVTCVCTSPLLRCRQTAEALSGAVLPILVENELHEMSYGVWEGMRFEDICAQYADLYAQRKNDMTLSPLGGEDVAVAGERGIAALRSLLERTQGDIAVAAHAGLNRALLWRLSGLPTSEIGRFHQDYVHLNVVEADGEILSVKAVNQNIEKFT